MAQWVRTGAIASLVGVASGFLSSAVGLLDFRSRVKQIEKTQTILLFQEKGKLKARYNSDVRPKLEQVKDICERQTNSRCESAEEIGKFAVWYGKNRYKQKDSKQKEDDIKRILKKMILKLIIDSKQKEDDIKAVNELRTTAVTFYDDLLESKLTTRFPADGERYDFVTLVAAVYQANMELGYLASANKKPYREPDVFVYTLRAISNSEMKKRAKQYRAKVKKQIKEAVATISAST